MTDGAEKVSFRFEVRTASEVTRLSVLGNWQGWQLSTSTDLKYTEGSGERQRRWRSQGAAAEARAVTRCRRRRR